MISIPGLSIILSNLIFVIFLELIIFFYNLVKKYFDAVDYQNNLVSELEKMPVTIVHKEELPLQLSFVNPLSIIVWKPNNEKN